MEQPDNAKKYLIKELPPQAYLAEATVVTVRQGYLHAEEDSELKVVERIEPGEFWFIGKTIVGGNRQKSKIQITKEIFDILFALTEGKRILKKTYEFKDGESSVRLDDFLQETSLGKIKIMEVDDPDQRKPLFEEAGMIDVVDVSSDPRYLNQNLAN